MGFIQNIQWKPLIGSILVTIILYVIAISFFNYIKIKSHNEWSSSTPNSKQHNFDISIRHSLIVPFYMEEYLTPRFSIIIRNVGEYMEKGELSCELVEHDEVSSFPNVKSNFKDFQHFRLDNFEKGERRKFTAVVKSKFIKPNRYMMRLLVKRYRPSGSLAEENLLQLEKLRDKYSPEEFEKNKKKSIVLLQEVAQKSNTNIDSIPIGQYVSDMVFNWRWSEVIKVHPLSFLGTIGSVTGITLVGFLFVLYKILNKLFK